MTSMKRFDVLVIDVEPGIGEGLGRDLGPGHRIRAAATGAEGLAAVGQRFPDVAVIGAGIPWNEGVEVLGTLRSRHPDLPVVVVTDNDAAQLTIIASGLFLRLVSDLLNDPLNRFLAVLFLTELKAVLNDPESFGPTQHTLNVGARVLTEIEERLVHEIVRHDDAGPLGGDIALAYAYLTDFVQNFGKHNVVHTGLAKRLQHFGWGVHHLRALGCVPEIIVSSHNSSIRPDSPGSLPDKRAEMRKILALW